MTCTVLKVEPDGAREECDISWHFEIIAIDQMTAVSAFIFLMRLDLAVICVEECVQDCCLRCKAAKPVVSSELCPTIGAVCASCMHALCILTALMFR